MSTDHGDYVRHVLKETQRYSENLLSENERLRTRVAALESELTSLGEKAREVDLLVESNEALQRERISLLAKLKDLRERAEHLGEEVARQEASRRDLEARLRTAKDESHRFAAEYHEVERQNANLANLYVASYRLHGTLDRGELLQSIQEIVSNLIGSEEMALFELAAGRRALRLVTCFGIEPGSFQSVPLDRGVIGRVARTGEAYAAGQCRAGEASPEEASLTACIPLKLEGKVIGALAIFRLLSHKAQLEPLDVELLDLLTNQAAIALYCTGLHAGLGTHGAEDS